MISMTSLLVVFLMLTLSSLAVFGARRIGVPHTVSLVGIGVVLGLLAYLPELSFLTHFKLTPELLFYLFLPTLIFESAYNIKVKKLLDDGPIITALAVVSLIVSTLLIGVFLYFTLGFIGITIPFTIALLFGALISATDPVAVLALFKEYGAPRRLSLIFEGESLFNDATAVAVFFILLEVLMKGFHGTTTVVEGLIMFTVMIVGGILFGLLTGLVFAQLIGWTRSNEAASITLTVVLAHVTFLLSELISHSVTIFGHHLTLSAITATTIASIVMGNYGRAKIHPRAEEFVEKLWGQLAFMVNSVIFVLVGLLFVSVPLTETSLYLPILVTILVVATARAISIYPVVGIFNKFTVPEARVPMAWQHLLSWGSLRGALAVTMVLLIPETLAIPGWELSVSPHDFILSLTIGCIFATIFVKATTIQWLMRKLKLDHMTDIESLEYQEALALTHHQVTTKLAYYAERNYISPELFAEFNAEHMREYDQACTSVRTLTTETKKDLTLRVVRMYAIGIERRYLKDLYQYGEVTEYAYRRISKKLSAQFEAIERGHVEPGGLVRVMYKGMTERFFDWVGEMITPTPKENHVIDLYRYYRAQSIISRKVLKEVSRISDQDAESIFTKEALEDCISLYKKFREQTQTKMLELESEFPEVIHPLKRELASFGITKVEEQTLDDLYHKELITPKLYVILKEKLGIH